MRCRALSCEIIWKGYEDVIILQGKRKKQHNENGIC
jgi:hypothetical protein